MRNFEDLFVGISSRLLDAERHYSAVCNLFPVEKIDPALTKAILSAGVISLQHVDRLSLLFSYLYQPPRPHPLAVAVALLSDANNWASTGEDRCIATQGCALALFEFKKLLIIEYEMLYRLSLQCAFHEVEDDLRRSIADEVFMLSTFSPFAFGLISSDCDTTATSKLN
jgi:hypothetical protein